jgi:hypothetical protein
MCGTPIEDPTSPFDRKEQERSAAADVIVNQIAEADFEIARPDWIPEYAYSNDSMVSCFHNTETSQKSIPCEPQWIKLAPSMVQFWGGAKIEPFWVITTVDQEHPGHFLFCSNYTGGPRGWLQKTKERSAWGHQEYRYWFDRK